MGSSSANGINYYNMNRQMPATAAHQVAGQDRKRAACTICGTSFGRISDLKRHIETVHEGKRTHCPQCSASFARKTDLKRHIETVHEGKKAQCTICSASCSRQTDLR